MIPFKSLFITAGKNILSTLLSNYALKTTHTTQRAGQSLLTMPRKTNTKRCPFSDVLNAHLNYSEKFYNSPKRKIHKSSKWKQGNFSGRNDSVPLPKVYYIQNPLAWILNKFDFKMLEKAWDPTFSQSEFLRGSRQAVSTITRLVTEKRLDELRGLLSRTAREELLRDLREPHAQPVAELLALSPANLQVATPRRVRFLKYQDRKFCDVDMIFVGLKWAVPHKSDRLVYAEIFARFRREYTIYSIPEWTVVYFKIVKFNVLTR